MEMSKGRSSERGAAHRAREGPDAVDLRADREPEGQQDVDRKCRIRLDYLVDDIEVPQHFPPAAGRGLLVAPAGRLGVIVVASVQEPLDARR